MEIPDALALLAQHQPLPSDDQLSAALLDKYDEVRRFFIKHPDPRCIPLFLNSFGDGSGFGVYQMVEDVFQMFPPEAVVPHLKESLSSPHKGVRYWGAQVAMLFPALELLEPLGTLLYAEDSDTRLFAAYALEVMWQEKREAQVIEVLKKASEAETDAEVKEVLSRVLLSSSEA
jgi:hypothetical protein